MTDEATGVGGVTVTEGGTESWKSGVLLLCAHKPCLARAAVTSWASVESCGDSSRLMLPAEDR